MMLKAHLVCLEYSESDTRGAKSKLHEWYRIPPDILCVQNRRILSHDTFTRFFVFCFICVIEWVYVTQVYWITE